MSQPADHEPTEQQHELTEQQHEPIEQQHELTGQQHELTEQQIDEILEHVRAIEAALPMLVGLGPQKKKRIIKAGPKSQAFIRKSLHLGAFFEAHMPRNLDLEAAHKRIELMDGLSRIELHVTRLASKLDDTHALVVTQAYDDALTIYRHRFARPTLRKRKPAP